MEGSSRDLISAGESHLMCRQDNEQLLTEMQQSETISTWGESPLFKHRSKSFWSPLLRSNPPGKVQTFLLFNHFLIIFDLVRDMILWDVCRFASEAFSISPTQVFNRFIFPTNMEMKVVSALSSKLHSCHGSFSWGHLLWACSYCIKAQSLRFVMLLKQLCLSTWCFTGLPSAQPLLITLAKAAVCESWIFNKFLDYWAPLVSCRHFV